MSLTSETKEDLSKAAEGLGQTAEAAAGDVSEADGSRQAEDTRSPSRPGSTIANKIAAFASGVAPVKKGIADASEDAITAEDVLHKLEAASRRPGDSNVQLPLPLVRSSYQHLVTARNEADRSAKELAELKASRVQLIPPSTWVKREAKYKMDQEKHEHTVSMLNQRIERLEAELQILREGANLKPLEEKIKDLESQLVAASEEKTKVQSKFHELSIKHRQLIETSPQVATIWNEVLVQQAQAHGDAAAEQRLRNFDLRHTGANSGLSMGIGQYRMPGAAPAAGEVSPQKLLGVSAAAAIFSNGGVPHGAGAHTDSRLAAVTGHHLFDAASIDGGPQTPVLFDSATSPMSSAASSRAVSAGTTPAVAAAAGPGPGSIGGAAAAAAQSSEERAHALMEAVALEGLSPEASIAALQQLNYDLTMQLGLYQQMVGRLKDAMEQSDLEKAELEADKSALEQQLSAAAAAGQADCLPTANSAGSMTAGSSSRRGWGLGGFWRRGGAMSAADEGEFEGSLADTSSVAGLASISSSTTTSTDLDSALANLGAPSGSALAARESAASTPVAGDTVDQQHQSPFGSADGGSNGSLQQQQQVNDAGAAGAAPGAAAFVPTPVRSSGGISRMLSQRRASAAARAATAAENMQKELKELKRQLTSVQEENKFLVHNLVEIKMELAETQGSHDQAKRALVRAMDKEVCLDTKVSELSHMLDMLTRQQAGADGSTTAAVPAALPGLAAAVIVTSGPAAAAEAIPSAMAPAAVARVPPEQQQSAGTMLQEIHEAKAQQGDVIVEATGIIPEGSAGDTQGPGWGPQQQGQVEAPQQPVDAAAYAGQSPSGAGDPQQQGQQQQKAEADGAASTSATATLKAVDDAGGSTSSDEGADSRASVLENDIDAHRISTSSNESSSTSNEGNNSAALLQETTAAETPGSAVAAASTPAGAISK